MKEPEVALNLWYVRDEDGLIYSLRVRAYVCRGTDDEILNFLRDRAGLDHAIAEPFTIPEGYHMTVRENGMDVKYPVAHVTMLDVTRPLPVFEEALRKIEEAFPAQTRLCVSEAPLVCVTALQQNENGAIEPIITGQVRF